MELQVTQDGKTGEAWVQGRKLRRNLPDGTYQIARDDKSWLVDEKANRAAVRHSDLFRGEAGQVDLLALLDFPVDQLADKQKQLLASQPAEQVTRDGRAVDIYRWDNAGEDGTLRIEAVVDAKTQLLQSLESLRVRGERTEPICRLAVIARDKPVNEDLFVVGDTLTEDGRIGKVTDAQGLVAIRPVMRDRFSPVTERMPVRPGDLLQTDPHGANAVSVCLVPQTELVIGPGSTVETGFGQAASRLRGRNQDQDRGQIADRSRRAGRQDDRGHRYANRPGRRQDTGQAGRASPLAPEL